MRNDENVSLDLLKWINIKILIYDYFFQRMVNKFKTPTKKKRFY